LTAERSAGDEKLVRNTPRLQQWVTWVLAALAGALAAGVVIAGASLLEQKATQRRDCEEIELVKSGLRETLEAAESFATSSHVRTAGEKEQIVTFYRDALGRLRPRHC
jgi:hypothetical protein